MDSYLDQCNEHLGQIDLQLEMFEGGKMRTLTKDSTGTWQDTTPKNIARLRKDRAMFVGLLEERTRRSKGSPA